MNPLEKNLLYQNLLYHWNDVDDLNFFLKNQIKTCQDCDQLRPFTVKRTCPAETRIKTDKIEFFWGPFLKLILLKKSASNQSGGQTHGWSSWKKEFIIIFFTWFVAG